MKRITILLLIAFVSVSSIYANADQAWEYLTNLESLKAQELFAQLRAEDPKNETFIRGLYLAASYNLEYDLMAAMVDTMLTYHPSSPYLVPMFEHFNMELEGFDYKENLSLKLGETLVEAATGATAHTGYKIAEKYYFLSMTAPPESWKDNVNFLTGAWICGPFDNTSRISVYRPLEIETAPFDTLVMIKGKQGFQAGWTWQDANATSDIYLGHAIDYEAGDAIVLKCFFELPSDTTVVFLPGGEYAGRMLIDGEKVIESFRYRNATQQDGCMVRLSQGVHSFTAVLCDISDPSSFSLEILDPSYKVIEGFKWLRNGKSHDTKPTDIKPISSIFDPWNDHIAINGSDPDTRFWETMLMIYNGYIQESVTQLEELANNNELSNLELHALFKGLSNNGEQTRGLEVLSDIRSQVACKAVDVVYFLNLSSTHVERIQNFEKLHQQHGPNLTIDMIVSLRPLLNSDIQGFFETMDSLKNQYPKCALLDQMLANMYMDSFKEYDKALTHHTAFCEQTGNTYLYKRDIAWYLLAVHKYDEACDAAEKTLGSFPLKTSLPQLTKSFSAAKRLSELITIIDSLIDRYPRNILLYSTKYDVLLEQGKYDAADSAISKIHQLKPAAVKPYMTLTELHNDHSLDSVLGFVDVMDYYQDLPDSTEFFKNNIWSLYDRSQELVTKEGPVLYDRQYAHVLLDESAVQKYQNFESPVDVNRGFNKLVIARRLRKDALPLDAQRQGNTAIFQDLKPGDIIEIRYRYWTDMSSDLWRHWWSSYMAKTNYYQHYWEYVVLTERDDVIFADDNFPYENTVDTHCGYKRYRWFSDKTNAVSNDLWYLPTDSEIYDELFISTLNSWDSISMWYHGVAEAILQDNPRADILADSLVDGKDSDYDKIKALYAYAILDIPYHALGFDYHASIPHNPDQVLFNGWGDCKDKSFLLIALLRQAGFTAWPVLVRTWDEGPTLPLPQFTFNHLITACLVDKDTVYLDPAGYPSPVGPWVSRDNAGQPCLHITESDNPELTYLPSIQPEFYIRHDSLYINVSLDEPSSYVYYRRYERLAAGWKRSYLKQYYQSEVNDAIEKNLSQAYDVMTYVDSTKIDSISSIEPTHQEYIYGTMDISPQKVGNTVILTPPGISPLSKKSLSNIYQNDKRDNPIDMHWRVRNRQRIVVLSLPPELGAPQLIPPVVEKNSLFEFSFNSHWDEKNNELILTYDMKVQNGSCSAEEYKTFAQKLIEVYDSPMIFTKQ